ncbi:MAG: DUF5798 family protein [Haloferacaceae archaeon]
MGLGGTAKKIQTLADTAEKMYTRMNDLREQVQATQESVTDTTRRVKRLENEMAEQRALLNAVAKELDVDVEKVSAEAHILNAEETEGDATGEEAPQGKAAEGAAADAGETDDDETGGDAG